MKSKQIIIILIFSSLIVSFSSCMQQNIIGNYSAKIYSYPNGTNNETLVNTEMKQYVDSNGVISMRMETTYLSVIPVRIESTTRFFMYIDNKLNIHASYSSGGISPAINYYGKGNLKHDTLYVQLFRKDIVEFGGNITDSLVYEKPIEVKFYVETDEYDSRKNLTLEYWPTEMMLNNGEANWSIHYVFKPQKASIKE